MALYVNDSEPIGNMIVQFHVAEEDLVRVQNKSNPMGEPRKSCAQLIRYDAAISKFITGFDKVLFLVISAYCAWKTTLCNKNSSKDGTTMESMIDASHIIGHCAVISVGYFVRLSKITRYLYFLKDANYSFSLLS